MTACLKDLSNLPVSIHTKAIEKACDDDRRWFAANPMRTARLRDIMPFEFNENMACLPEGLKYKVIVVQIVVGVRHRTPISLSVNANEDCSDETIIKLLCAVAPWAAELVRKLNAKKDSL